MGLGRIELKWARAGGSQKVDGALLLIKNFEPTTEGVWKTSAGRALSESAHSYICVNVYICICVSEHVLSMCI